MRDIKRELQVELEQLVERIKKLEPFINNEYTGKTNILSKNHFAFITVQMQGMELYKGSLELRIIELEKEDK